MHAVVRSYSGQGAKDLFDLLEKRTDDLRSIISSAPGFVSYTLMRAGNGGVSVTVCRDKEGTDDSSQKARKWIQENASNLKVSPPSVQEGAVLLTLP